MTRQTEILDSECRVFTRYLIGEDPDAYVQEKYREAHRVVRSLQLSGPLDRAMLRRAGRGPWWTGCADAYARFFAGRGLLRRKLIVLFAILETSAPSYRRVDAVASGGAARHWLGLVVTGIAATIRLLAGLVLFAPLGLRHGKERG